MTFATLPDPTTLQILDAFADQGLIPNWIDGSAMEASEDRTLPIYSPYNGGVLGQVPLSTTADLERAVSSAARAFPEWSGTNIKDRSQVTYRLRQLLHEEIDALAQTVALENGKTIAEAKAEILKGIEVVEFACSLPNLITGRILAVSDGVDCSVTREPLGVVASITPANFPLMVPLWTVPIILTLGNTMILKPSEQVPLSAMKLADLLKRAGLPDGVFNVVHGDRELVEAICLEPRIEAVSFVGSTGAARSVYRLGCSTDKRVLAMGGAKNHVILMPDADPERSPKAIVDSAIGCAGQRCMAASVCVAVEGSDTIIEDMARYAATVTMPADMGAILNAPSVERIRGYIDQAEQSDAEILHDGRHPEVADVLQTGYWVGPTLIDGVRPDMPAAQDEIFGPVLSIIRVKDLDEALAVENANLYGNGAAIFTSSGESAREATRRMSAGMVGVNIGVPVPREPFAFGGWNASKFGVGDITGESSVGFWTRDKKVTVRWRP